MAAKSTEIHPGVDVEKRTTKVNLGIIISIILFLVVAGVVVFSLREDPSSARTETVPLP